MTKLLPLTLTLLVSLTTTASASWFNGFDNNAEINNKIMIVTSNTAHYVPLDYNPYIAAQQPLNYTQMGQRKTQRLQAKATLNHVNIPQYASN